MNIIKCQWKNRQGAAKLALWAQPGASVEGLFVLGGSGKGSLGGALKKACEKC